MAKKQISGPIFGPQNLCREFYFYDLILRKLSYGNTDGQTDTRTTMVSLQAVVLTSSVQKYLPEDSISCLFQIWKF